MTICRRCDWHPDTEDPRPGREQLAEHAQEFGHPLCLIGPHSLTLTEHEQRVCERCLANVRDDLARIVELYALLPDVIGHPKAQVYDRDSRGGGDTLSMPGGSALTLLAPGADGRLPRRLTRAEQAMANEPLEPLEPIPGSDPPEYVYWWLPNAIGPLSEVAYRVAQFRLEAARRQREQARQGREHAADNLPDDPPSTAYELARWEDDWRHTLGEPAAESEATVMGAAGYLERRMRQAAQGHDAFDEFAGDLRKLVQALEATTSTSSRAKRDPVACFDCGQSTLERAYREPDPCEHVRPAFPKARRLHDDPACRPDGHPPDEPWKCPHWWPLSERRRVHEAELEHWAKQHERCDQGGLEAHWTCRSCHRVYEDSEYWQAVHQAMHERARRREAS